MNGRNVARALAVVLVAVGAVALGAIIYQAGVADGAASAAAGGQAVHYVGHWGPWFGFGWGFFGLLFPLLFVFILFGLIRAAFWGGRPYRRWRYGPPPDVEEWHRRMHDRGQAPRDWTDRSNGPGDAGTAPR